MGTSREKKGIPFIAMAVWAMGVLLNMSAWAQERALTPHDLREYPHRPSVAEIYEANRERIDRAIFLLKPPELASYEDLAMAIAMAEKVYPNLTYAVLGRDAAFIGDLLDAFYLANGQPGRVRFLDGSGTSIRPASQEQLFLLMRQNGLKIGKEGLERPFVVIDRTDFGKDSQLRRLTTSATQLLLKSGFNIKTLRRQIGAANTSSSGMTAQQLDEFPFAFSAQGPQTPLTLPVASYTDTAFWHETFEKFQLDSNGRIIAPPGSQVLDPYSVMAQWARALPVVMSPRFLELVHVKAMEIGYQFPIQEQPKQKRLLTPFEAWRAAGAAKTFQERAAVLEFVSWFQGSVEQRLKILRHLNLANANYQKRREMLIARFSADASEITLNVAQAISAFDILEQAQELESGENRSQKDEVVIERMQNILMDSFENVVILDEQSGRLRETPELKMALHGLLIDPQNPAARATLRDLETRWSLAFTAPLAVSPLKRIRERALNFYEGKWKVPMTGGERLSYGVYSTASLLPVDTLLLQFAPSLDASTVVGLNIGVAMAAFQYFKFAWSKPTTTPATTMQSKILETRKASSSVAKNPNLFLSAIQSKGERACIPSLMRKGK